MSSPPPADSSERPDDPSAELLRRWQEQGDRAALDELIALEITRLKQRIRARADYMTEPAASASDVAQEAAVRLLGLESLPRFDNPAALRGYLWTIAWRLLLDRLRCAGRSPVYLDASSSGELGSQLETDGDISGVERQELSSALGLAVNLLEPHEQEILTLVHFSGKGIAEAALALGVSHDAANMRLVRARRSLAKKLLRWGDLVG